MRRNNKGFTLVETIVILVILAILAAIMVPALTGWMDQAREKRLIVACRTCVTAAQTLALEAYGAEQSTAVPDEQDVLDLAGVSGTVSGITMDTASVLVNTLTYAEGAESITYYRLPQPRYTSNATPPTPAWASGISYAVGDRITAGDYIFECARAHTSGTTNATRNPTVGQNKSTWRIVGIVSASIPAYSSQYRYWEGALATDSNGNVYRRTAESLGNDQAPFIGSPRWELVSAAP